MGAVRQEDGAGLGGHCTAGCHWNCWWHEDTTDPSDWVGARSGGVERLMGLDLVWRACKCSVNRYSSKS